MLRNSVAVVLCGCLFAGCGGGGASSSAPGNPSSVVVTVNFDGGPFAGVAVTLSTGLNGQTPTGVISTTATNSAGQVTLSLPPDGTLCVSATESINAGTSFAGQCLSPPFPSTLSLTLN